MLAKAFFTALVTVMFSMSSFAGVMNKAEASKRLTELHKVEVEKAEDFKKSFEEAKGDMKKLSSEKKKQFNEAISILSSKVGLSSIALQRVFLRKSDILSDVIRLEASLRSGAAEEKEAARTQIELIENVGRTLDSQNYKSLEAQAATKLLQLDLTTLPAKATEVVKAVNDNIRQGKSLVDSIKEGTKGMKGSLEDLISCV